MLFQFLLLSITFVGFVACGTGSSSTGDALGKPLDNGAVAVEGRCCPAHTGGCALTGGYHADGTCPNVQNDICDHMCEQRIEPDAYGCDHLVYKIPSTNTTYAGTESCSDPKFRTR
jgi:hypothetical protein